MCTVRASRVRALVALLALAALVAASPSAQTPLQRILTPGDLSGRADALAAIGTSGFAAAPPAWTLRLDPVARALALGGTDVSRSASMVERGGERLVDLLVQTTDAAALRSGLPGVEVRAVAGDIAVVRAPVEAIEALATHPSVRFVEAALVRERLNDSGRADLRADAVHAGTNGLPRGYRGAGVVVGVLDSGLDVTHPDFFNASGSRVQFLLEFLQGGGQAVYTKSQIDANPAAIPQRDGNGGGGHGTHVTGSAAGGGQFNPSMRGVAPEADIVFVKGVRHPDSQGGFSDADVIAGTDFIFQRAAQLGRPAVVNLSLGGHMGSPHDGTSLYEQALSNLGGPGRIVVAAAGNDGFSYIHAGEPVSGGIVNETLVLPSNPNQVVSQLWYDAGSQNQFAIGAYFVSGGQLQWLGLMGVNAGQILGSNGQPVPFVVNGTQIGRVYIDATAVQDPRNGDGNVFFAIVGGNGIDIRNIVWSIITTGPTAGRNDMWIQDGEFYAGTGVLSGVNEIPGDRNMTVGTPSTALGVIAIGSHVTNNDWVDVDGVPRQWPNPNPDGNPNSPQVIPTLGQRSYFSSRGPTRDGRTSPDLSAPGEYIFSPLSSHVTVGGASLPRPEVMQGGRYRGMQGTSMASPHATGVVALMLEVNPQLTPTQVRQILQQTARTDGHTGGVPNNLFGAGKADALAAVLRTIQLCGSACGGGGSGTTFAEVEPNNTVAQAQSLGGGAPLTLNGAAQHSDVGALGVTYTGGIFDDFEDLFRVTTTAPGLVLTLGGFNRDLDLFLLNAAGNQILAASNAVGETGTETINQASLPPGTYLVAVSFYDGTGETGQTNYQLVATGTFAVNDDEAPSAGRIALHPPTPNPTRGAAVVTLDLPAPQAAHVAVYDVLGREVLLLSDGPLAAGLHRLPVDGGVLGAGVYVVRLRTESDVRTRTLVVAR